MWLNPRLSFLTQIIRSLLTMVPEPGGNCSRGEATCYVVAPTEGLHGFHLIPSQPSRFINHVSRLTFHAWTKFLPLSATRSKVPRSSR